MRRFDDAHRLATITMFAAVIAVSLFWNPVDLLDWPVEAAILILVLGVPHGALDVAIIQHRGGAAHPRALSWVLALYLGLALTVVCAWSLLPTFFLPAFLLYSAYHFGGDWVPDGARLKRLGFGAALLAATTIFHQSQVAHIFDWLTPNGPAEPLAQTMHAVAFPLLLVSGFMSLRLGRESPAAALEFATTLLAAVVLPPITFFALYFCFLHSVRHLAYVRRELYTQSALQIARSGAPYAIAAVAGTLAGAALLFNLDPGPALLSAVFVSLAALTVPHMALVDGA
jgi:beta-carotene 15,15'-dioxygenase